MHGLGVWCAHSQPLALATAIPHPIGADLYGAEVEWMLRSGNAVASAIFMISWFDFLCAVVVHYDQFRCPLNC